MGMDPKIKLNGLDQFLTAIYGDEMSTLLDSLGFETKQVNLLREKHMETIVEQFIEMIRKRLTWEEKDLWFRILARRFGLDGEPASAIEAVAVSLSIDPAYAVYAEGEALQKCRTKTTLQDFRKELHRIALNELSRHGDRPAKEHVVDKLNRLTDLRAAVDLIQMDLESKRKAIMQKVQIELDALEEEYNPVIEKAENNAALLESEIKNDVLLRGESVRNEHFQAVYMKGRISWDNDGIGEYARVHPEVLKFRKEGQPTVSLRLSAKGQRNSDDQ
jgi:hypothetical protein